MRLPLLLLFFLPLLGIAQSVKLNVYDNFIKTQRIELDPVAIYSSVRSKTALSFSSIGPNLYMQLSGWGWGASTIDEGDKLLLRFSNGSSVTVKSIGVQSFEPGIHQNTYHHQYFITPTDLEVLSKNQLASIRKFSFKESSEIYIAKEDRYKVQKLSSLFSNEVVKAKVFKTLKSANLKDINRYIGDSVQICTKIYNSRYYESSEDHPTVFDVQANYLDPIVKVVILEEDRQNFVDNPEKVYLNKDVCISGLLTLRNNIPCIFLHNREQIKVKTPPTLQDVGLYVGDSITVTGKVHTTKYFSETPNKPTLLNMGAAFPNQLLTVLIEKGDRGRFKPEPEVLYLNREISVSGRVILYKNKPEIIVRSQSQIKILDNGQQTIGSVAPVQNATNKSGSGAKEMETPAQFPGGEEAWLKFLNDHLKYPKNLKEGETKTVVASFYVEIDGGISKIGIIQSAGTEYDNEALRILSKMPRWKPKSRDNLLMGTTVSQPIVFKKL